MPSFMIDEKKNLVESQGFLLDERKNLVKDQGYVIDEKKNLVEYQGGGEVDPPITEEVNMIKKTFGITYDKTGIIGITGYSASSVDFSKFICGKFIFDDDIYTSINRLDMSTGFPAFISLVTTDSGTYTKNDVFVNVLFASDTMGMMTIQNNENETVISDTWSKIKKIDIYLES